MKILERIPQPLFVFTVILIGSIFIYFSNPPKSVCDVEYESFREALKGLIFKSSDSSTSQGTYFNRTYDQCLKGNSNGSCLEFFQVIDKFLLNINALHSECSATIQEIPEVQSTLSRSLKLLVILAWGVAPQENGEINFQWFSLREHQLFCNLKNLYIKIYENDEVEESPWLNFANQVVSTLPKPKEMLAGEALRLSLFSLMCEKVL